MGSLTRRPHGTYNKLMQEETTIEDMEDDTINKVAAFSVSLRMTRTLPDTDFGPLAA